MENMDQYKTPGQLVGALISKRGWTNRLVAAVLNRNETAISKIISDTAPMTAELAIQLEEVFMVPAEHFLALQKSFDLAKARYTTTPDPKRASRAKLLNDLPISEMVNRGWLSISNTKDIQEIETAIAKYFNVEGDNWIDVLPHAAKKTNVNEEIAPVQLAWLYRVSSIASGMLAKPYSKQ
jgi:HTH-type transcriptional regulator/antitoxin HigA